MTDSIDFLSAGPSARVCRGQGMGNLRAVPALKYLVQCHKSINIGRIHSNVCHCVSVWTPIINMMEVVFVGYVAKYGTGSIHSFNNILLTCFCQSFENLLLKYFINLLLEYIVRLVGPILSFGRVVWIFRKCS
jgi:hypothetical protein